MCGHCDQVSFAVATIVYVPYQTKLLCYLEALSAMMCVEEYTKENI